MYLYRRFLYFLLVVGVRKNSDVVVKHVDWIVVVQRAQRDCISHSILYNELQSSRLQHHIICSLPRGSHNAGFWQGRAEPCNLSDGRK